MIALVKPIHKDNVSNYRAISILLTLSKILERLINVRLIGFLEAIALLSPAQFGFRSGNSIDYAVHRLINYIIS